MDRSLSACPIGPTSGGREGAAGLLQWLPLEWLLRPPVQLELQLAATGLSGLEPLPWWAAGPYDGGLRRHLLALRRNPSSRRLAILLPGLIAGLRQLREQCRPAPPPLLVAIPSWKRHANPLPPLLTAVLARQLGWSHGRPLARSRPVLGQHRLGRDLRWQNQQGAFRCLQRADRPSRGVLLVDDILTTGATACAARAALREGGWDVLGMACLGRTPAPARHRQSRDLGSPRRSGRRQCGPGADTPG